MHSAPWLSLIGIVIVLLLGLFISLNQHDRGGKLNPRAIPLGVFPLMIFAPKIAYFQQHERFLWNLFWTYAISLLLLVAINEVLLRKKSSLDGNWGGKEL